MMSDDELEVYVYQGNDGETVPRTVQHLIVHDRVQVLPDNLCRRRIYFSRLQKVTLHNGLVKIGDSAFDLCENLSEINKIPSTVQVIGNSAFHGCESLKAIEFDDRNDSLPHQLQQIGKAAFALCWDLERIKLPSYVNFVGESAFVDCKSLTEANLTATRIVKIPPQAFAECFSLQTVSLPNTVERICEWAFEDCKELVTVAIPSDSKPIAIGSRSFAKVLPTFAFQKVQQSRKLQV